MGNTETFKNINPLAEGSILSSKFLNPEYLFDRLVEYVFPIISSDTLNIIYFILSFFSIFFIVVIIYSTIRIFEIRKKEHEHLHHEIMEYAHHQAKKEQESKSKETYRNPRWGKIINSLHSNNENDWKLSIIEADSMLFDLLTQLGFKGDTLGDKLKTANRDTFRSLSDAWEAHNIRNRISHEGSDFELSLREANRVIALYQVIFQEFGFI